MNKFSEKDDIVKKYAGNQVLRNKIYDIIEETLSVKVDGKINENISIEGKEELVENIHRFISAKTILSKINELNKFKSEPIKKEKPIEHLVEKTIVFNYLNENYTGKVVDQYFDNEWIYIVENDGVNYPIRKENIISE